jgi:hypothetical protein
MGAATVAPLALTHRAAAQSAANPERFDIVVAGAGHNNSNIFSIYPLLAPSCGYVIDFASRSARFSASGFWLAFAFSRLKVRF